MTPDILNLIIHAIYSFVQLVLAVSITVSMLSMPFLFTFYIIPKIEKRVGKKLEFVMPNYYLLPGSKFVTGYFEISWCIIKKYLMWKLNKLNYNSIKPNSKWALWRSNYRIEGASRFEIFISFFALINIILFFLIGSIAWIQSKFSGS